MFGRISRSIDREIEEHAIPRAVVGALTAVILPFAVSPYIPEETKPNILLLFALSALTGLIAGVISKPSPSKNGVVNGACLGIMPSMLISTVIMLYHKKDDAVALAAFRSLYLSVIYSPLAAITANRTHHLLDNNHRPQRRS